MSRALTGAGPGGVPLSGTGAMVAAAVLAAIVVTAWLAARLAGATRRRRRLARVAVPLAAGASPHDRAGLPSGRGAASGPTSSAQAAGFSGWAEHPRVAAAAGALLAAVPAGWAAGPVAGVAAAGYATVGVLAWLGRRHRATESEAAARALDAVAALAADLRTGLPPAEALAVALPALSAAPEMSGTPGLVAMRVGVAWRVAEQAGSPLADLLDRLDSDLRASVRATAAALAQAAGVRATALLLAVLPVAGLGLGFAIGVDPVRVLLHTPAGAACALSSLACQLAGIAWSNRLIRAVERAGC